MMYIHMYAYIFMHIYIYIQTYIYILTCTDGGVRKGNDKHPLAVRKYWHLYLCVIHICILCIHKFISVRVCACMWSQLYLFLVRCACILLWGVLRIGKRCGLECSICAVSCLLCYGLFFWHVYRGTALNVQVHAMQMGMYHASMTRACRQRQRQRQSHALTACCAIAQVPGSLW